MPIMALHSLAAEENAVAWRGVEEREEDHLARDLARDEHLVRLGGVGLSLPLV